jgi:hypothetical protein
MPCGANTDCFGPNRPVRPNSYSEGENESPKLLDVEQAEVEREPPVAENEPVERAPLYETSSPLFDE